LLKKYNIHSQTFFLDLSRDLNWKEEVDKEFQTQTNTTIKEREKQEQEINCGNDVRFQTEEILQTSEKQN
jgi:hypothetical protein